MKFTTTRKDLLDAMLWAQHALPAHHGTSIMSGVRLSAVDCLTVSAFDYAATYSMRVAADVADGGEVLLPGRHLLAMVRQLPAKAQVSVESDGGTTTLRSGGLALTVDEMDLSKYPLTPDMPALVGVVDGAVLRQAIGQAESASCRDDTLPVICTVHTEITAKTCILVTTDRYRLHAVPVDWAGSSKSGSVNVPTEHFTAWRKAVKAGVVSVHADVKPTRQGRQFFALTDGVRTVLAGTVVSEYIRWRERFPVPANLPMRVRVDAQALAAAVRRIGRLTERNEAVLVSADASGTVTVEASGMSETLGGAELDGAPLRLRFNPGFLADALEVFSGSVLLAGTCGQKPAVVAADDSPVLVMLMTIKD
jgi:DNA polymerase III subunit beta